MIKGSVLENATQFLIERKGADIVHELEPELGAMVYDTHAFYPVDQFLKLQDTIIKLISPNDSEQGLKELGRYAFNSYAKSLIGGTMINHTKNAQELLEQVQNQWNQVLNFGQRSLTEFNTANRTAELEIKDDPRQPAYLAGVIEAGLQSIGLTPQLSTETIGDHDYKFIIRW